MTSAALALPARPSCRRRRRLGRRVAVGLALGWLAAALLLAAVVDQQAASDRSLLSQAARGAAGDARNAPPGTWLAVVEDGDYTGTAGMPADLPYIPDLDAVQRGAPPISRQVDVGGRHLRLLTESRRLGAVQVGLDVTAQTQQHRRLLGILVASAGGGVALAVIAVVADGGPLVERRS